jgi:hypothetical protein
MPFQSLRILPLVITIIACFAYSASAFSGKIKAKPFESIKTWYNFT